MLDLQKADILTTGKEKGVVALFENPDQLIKAAAAIRDKQVKLFDAFSPFPVHGIEEAMGLKRSFLPWVTFIAGLTGCSIGLGFQVWVSAITWPLNVGGKPFLSIPAFIPVMFELTVLLAGLATAFTMLFVAGLPRIGVKVLDLNITNDKFALFVSAEDAKYSESEFKELLKRAGAHEVRVV